MKKLFLVAGVGATLLSMAGQAISACTDPRLTPNQIRALLNNNTVCVPVTTVDPMIWQELHASVGTTGSSNGPAPLTDYKRGFPHATDPSKVVGEWSISGSGSNAFVVHNYGTGGTYTYSVHGSGVVGTNHSFCSANPEIIARVKSGGGAC